MAKVFAVILKNKKLVLKTWFSAKLFEKTESWVDDKFICLATSDGFKGKNSFPLSPIYDEKAAFTELNCNGYCIFQSKNEIEAHNIMHEARNKHLGIL
mgnify:FL=1